MNCVFSIAMDSGDGNGNGGDPTQNSWKPYTAGENFMDQDVGASSSPAKVGEIDARKDQEMRNNVSKLRVVKMVRRAR